MNQEYDMKARGCARAIFLQYNILYIMERKADANNPSVLEKNTRGQGFQCPSEGCGRVFSAKFLLNRHMVIHSEVKKYKCEYCQKSFSLPQYWKEHVYIHTKELPYECGVAGCTMRFRQAGKLSLHRRTHPEYTLKKYNYPTNQPKRANTNTKKKRSQPTPVVEEKTIKQEASPEAPVVQEPEKPVKAGCNFPAQLARQRTRQTIEYDSVHDGNADISHGDQEPPLKPLPCISLMPVPQPQTQNVQANTGGIPSLLQGPGGNGDVSKILNRVCVVPCVITLPNAESNPIAPVPGVSGPPCPSPWSIPTPACSLDLFSLASKYEQHIN